MEVDMAAKSKELHNAKYALNLELLGKKVSQLIDDMKKLKEENSSLKAKNKDLAGQLKAVEGSLVAETKDLEELSQEKMMAKIVLDNLLHSIDELIEVR